MRLLDANTTATGLMSQTDKNKNLNNWLMYVMCWHWLNDLGQTKKNLFHTLQQRHALRHPHHPNQLKQQHRLPMGKRVHLACPRGAVR